MAMSPRKMMAMGKSGEKKTKSVVKLRNGGEAKKPASKKAGKGMTESPRPVPRPYTMEDREAVIRGNRAAARGLRMGGMVKK